MMGNEGSGMNEKQLAVCDYFVRVSQYGGGTASLNVNVCANLIMHRFMISNYVPTTINSDTKS